MTRWGEKLSEGECYKENDLATEAITTHHTSGVGMTWLFASCLVFVFVYLSFIPPVSLSTKRSAQDINHSSPILKLFQFMDGGNFPTGHWVGRSLCQTLAALKDASLQLGYPPKTTFVSILRPSISDARIARTGCKS